MALNPALTALFNAVIAQTAQLFVWRLYTITPTSGPAIRFADADFDILGVSTNALVNGFKYSSSTLRIDAKESKTQWHAKVGLDVDTYTLVVMPRPFDPITGTAFPDTIGNVPWLAAASAGALAGADFQVDEAYFGSLPTWPMSAAGASPVGCKTIFKGTLGEIDTTNALAVLNANDYRLLFSISYPIHYFSGQCRFTLYGAGCNASGNMNVASFAKASAAAGNSTQSSIIGAPLPAPGGSGTYTQGRLQMTGGLNSGFWRTVRAWDGANTLSLFTPLPFAVAAGDTFNAYPGCNKIFSTCQLFQPSSAAANFGGQVNIPAPEVQQ